MSRIKIILSRYASLINLIPIINRGLYSKGLVVKSNHGLLIKCKVVNRGNDNKIILEDGCILHNCSFSFLGSNNTVIIKRNVSIVNSVFYMEDNNNRITINDNTKVCGKNEFACIESTEIDIGKDCLFSGDIHFRTGDSHSVLDKEGKRINPSCSINISDHVWIGQRVTILKGVSIPNNCIIGIDAVVTRKFEESHTAIAGNPAKIIKHNIDWDSKRIPISN